MEKVLLKNTESAPKIETKKVMMVKGKSLEHSNPKRKSVSKPKLKEYKLIISTEKVVGGAGFNPNGYQSTSSWSLRKPATPGCSTARTRDNRAARMLQLSR